MPTRAQMHADYVWRGCTMIAVHAIGPYEIVEYWHLPGCNVPDQTRERHFGVYIDGKRMGESFLSLDEALVGCIALRHEGHSHRADGYFFRMVGVDSVPEKEPAETVSAAS